jgi:hypothetical protein
VLWPLDLPPYEGMRLNSSQGLWAGRSPAQVPRSPAPVPRCGEGGGRRGGCVSWGLETAPPQSFLRSCWVGEGPWAYQEGQMGQKMVCFGGLGGRDLVKASRKRCMKWGRNGRLRGAMGGMSVGGLG